jgi:hypothetical protein
VEPVALDYYRFHPTGRAYITLTHPDFLRPNLNILAKASIATIPISAVPSPPPENSPSRMRGAKGRAEAALRGVANGNGPNAGTRNPSRYVVMWGLPGKMKIHELREFLRPFVLSGADHGQPEIVKLARSAFFL